MTNFFINVERIINKCLMSKYKYVLGRLYNTRDTSAESSTFIFFSWTAPNSPTEKKSFCTASSSRFHSNWTVVRSCSGMNLSWSRRHVQQTCQRAWRLSLSLDKWTWRVCHFNFTRLTWWDKRDESVGERAEIHRNLVCSSSKSIIGRRGCLHSFLC